MWGVVFGVRPCLLGDPCLQSRWCLTRQSGVGGRAPRAVCLSVQNGAKMILHHHFFEMSCATKSTFFSIVEGIEISRELFQLLPNLAQNDNI